MIENDEILNLKNMVGDGKALTVLHELKSKLVNSEFYDEIIFLLYSFNRIQKKRRGNLFTFQEEMLAENALVFALLEILKELELHNTSKYNSELTDVLSSQINDITKTSNQGIESSKGHISHKNININKNINILILGQAGAGKSTFINSIFEKEVAEVGSFTITTLSVELYRLHLNNSQKTVTVQFVDTPGLDTQHVNNIGENRLIFDVVRSKIQKIDILLFVKSMAYRLDIREEYIKLISNELGKDIWERTIFIFSHSDQRLEKGAFEFYPVMHGAIKLIQHEISRYIDCKKSLDLSFLPIYFQENVMNEPNWTSRFWSEVQSILNKQS